MEQYRIKEEIKESKTVYTSQMRKKILGLFFLPFGLGFTNLTSDGYLKGDTGNNMFYCQCTFNERKYAQQVIDEHRQKLADERSLRVRYTSA